MAVRPGGFTAANVGRWAPAAPTSSSNIGDLNAPAWKSGGPTSGSGAWGTIAVTLEETLVLSYPTSTGTAGFVHLQCTGDTDSFKLTAVEGEEINTPKTFQQLTNNNDLMYIAFQGTTSGADQLVEIKILPVYTNGAAKSMEIKAFDHQGTEINKVSATATVQNLVTVIPTGIGDFTGIAQRSNGDVMTAWGTNGGKTGIHKTLYQGGWGDAGQGVGSFCRIDKEITSGGYGYVQYTPTSAGDHMNMGIGYLTDYDFVIPSNTTANYAPKAQRWAFYNWGGQDITATSNYNSAATAVMFDPSPSVQGSSAHQNQAGRTIRLEWLNNTVQLKYSDDAFASHSVTVHTFALAIDIVSNGNLIVSFANYNNAPATPNNVFESIKLHGVLA